MQPLKTLNDMIIFLQQRRNRKRVAVVCANDASTRYAVEKGNEMGFIEPIYVDGDDRDECASRAVAMVRNGEADILMKGLINTDVLLRAILNKDTGILRPGRVLTHIAMAEIPKYEKVLFFTDAAVIPVPTYEQRRQQIDYVNYVCHALGIVEPRIALIHCAEKVSEKTFPYTKDYIKDHPNVDYFIYGHRHIELDLQLTKRSRIIILGDWITQFTYVVFDGNHFFISQYIEGESKM